MATHYTELMAGTEALVTTLGIFSANKGVIPAFTPLMQEDATGALVVWDGSSVGKAVYVSAVQIDTAKKTQAQVYKTGVLNVDALNWPESVKELSVKIAAFVGSGISVQPLARVKGDTMQNDYNDLKPLAEMMYPNPAVEELKAIADKMCLSERLVDMNQVMEITTLSRRTLLNLEASGEFPERVQVTEGRKAWYLSEVIDWINNIPRASEYCRVPVPKKPDAALCLKIERVRRNARDGRYKLIG